MKVIHQEESFYTFSFSKAEEVMSTLKAYCQEHGIKAAHIAGLGAADRLELAYYNIGSKEYERHTVEEAVEILNLNGNIGINTAGETVVHMHGTFGRQDLSVFGGHIFTMRISGAGELHVKVFAGAINRAYDDVKGLTLMCEVPEDI
jgi:predicted DNA-binding protein with PD1-like motif